MVGLAERLVSRTGDEEEAFPVAGQPFKESFRIVRGTDSIFRTLGDEESDVASDASGGWQERGFRLEEARCKAERDPMVAARSLEG